MSPAVRLVIYQLDKLWTLMQIIVQWWLWHNLWVVLYHAELEENNRVFFFFQSMYLTATKHSWSNEIPQGCCLPCFPQGHTSPGLLGEECSQGNPHNHITLCLQFLPFEYSNHST